MNINRVLQPHVCCIGNPVAGNPTQFVMYRAARAAGVDWRFFTSQVAVDQFEKAFRGVQALGLDGAAIFEPFQSAAIPLLDSVTESALLLGKVNVARSDNNSWLGDNTLGSAIAKLVETRLASNPRALANDQVSVTVDEAREVESLLAIVDSPAVARAIQLASTLDTTRILSLRTAEHFVGLDSGTYPTIAKPESDAHSVFCETVESLSESHQPVEFVILATFPTQLQFRKLAMLPWASNAKCILLNQFADGISRPMKAFLSEHSLSLIEPAELMAYQAAADFHFWTGVAPSVELIRDSLEEYLQW